MTTSTSQWSSTDRFAAFDETDPDSFFSLEDEFVALLTSGAFTGYLNQQLDYLIEWHETAPELGMSGGRRFAVAGTGSCQLSLEMTAAAGAASIAHSSACHKLIGFIAGGSVTLRRFEQLRPDPDDVFDPARTLVPRPDAELSINSPVVRQRAARDILVPEPAATGTLLATLNSPKVSALHWEYDVTTRTPRRMIAADTGTTRLSYAATLLAQMGSVESLPQLIRLTDHRDYTVRWTALRAITTLDPVTGLELVRAAMTDSHPHIRAAAERASARLSAS